ncbi:hypothetical protein BJV82DRAFT_598557 [Fennellomyces sp. T-0311]|nr:hypothetical protein BJV82DRAFT_598557 [Fennellomyces sp. T-0311]
MKIKLVTLASVLALTSVNALPAAEGPANEGTSMAPVNNAVAQAEGNDVEVNNKELDNSRIGLIPIPIVDDLLKLLEAVLDFIIDLLAGRSSTSFLTPTLQELIQAILRLFGVKSGGGGTVAPLTPAAVPATEDPVDIMKTFIANMRSGYSGMEAANDEPLKVIAAALSLYSQIPKENLPDQQASA